RTNPAEPTRGPAGCGRGHPDDCGPRHPARHPHGNIHSVSHVGTHEHMTIPPPAGAARMTMPNRPANRSYGRGTPEPPEGWPVGSFPTYAQAQAAVDELSDRNEFPVSDLTIVGVDLMQVERVVGRLTWGKVIGGGALYGVWLGLFFGLLLGLFNPNWVAPLVVGVVAGAVFGIVLAAVPYGMQQGRRDFASS